MTPVALASTVAPTASASSAGANSNSDGVFATVLTAADNSTAPGDADSATAPDGNAAGNAAGTEESAPPTVTPPVARAVTSTVLLTVPALDQLGPPAETVTVPTVTATTATPPTVTASDDTVDAEADASSTNTAAMLTDSADPASPSPTGNDVDTDGVDGSDRTKTEADEPDGAPLALGVLPGPVAHDVGRSVASEVGGGRRETSVLTSPPPAAPDAQVPDATNADATNADATNADATSADIGAEVGEPIRPVVATPNAALASRRATALAAHVATSPAQPVSAPVAESAPDATTTATSSNSDPAERPPATDRPGVPALADTVRPASEVPTAGPDRPVQTTGPTPSRSSTVSSGTGQGVPVTTTLPFGGSDMTAWRHLRSGSTSTMSMDVDTDTLGTLRIAASDIDGSVRLSLLSDDALSRNLLADRLPELRRDLADAGIDFADLDVADRNAGQRHSQPSDRTDRTGPAPTGAATGSPDRRVATITSPPTVAGHLDLRL